MKVAKFGGSSLASPEQVQKVCDIIESDPKRRLIVVSAPGKRMPDDTKVTDLLIQCATKHLRNDSTEAVLEEIVSRVCRYRSSFFCF